MKINFTMMLMVLPLLASCDRSSSTRRTYTETIGEAPAPAQASAMNDTNLVSLLIANMPAPGSLSWKGPDGWVEAKASGMRLASFAVGSGAVTGDCSIIVLAGVAGGVGPNIARWAGQLGLEVTAESLDAFIGGQTSGTTESGSEWLLVDFSTWPGASAQAQSMLAGIITRPDQSIFIKFTGPSALLQQERDRFVALCRSVK